MIKKKQKDNQVCWKCKFDGKGLYHKFFINGKPVFLCSNCFEIWKTKSNPEFWLGE